MKYISQLKINTWLVSVLSLLTQSGSECHKWFAVRRETLSDCSHYPLLCPLRTASHNRAGATVLPTRAKL